MSWITDLAGKAEDFLVKIDKSAADRLTKEKGGTPGHSRQHSTASVTSVASVGSVVSRSSEVSTSLSNGKPSFSSFKSSVSGSDTIKSSNSKVDLDAVLMESLNHDDHSLDPSPSLASLPPVKNNGLSLEQENVLLNQEIKGLNQEIRQTAQSVRQAEKDAKLAQQQLKSQVASVKSLEEELSKLRKENVSLADSILDKDAELATLKSRLKSVDIEQEQRGKLENVHTQLETEIKLKESLQKEIKLHASQFHNEKSSWLAEAEQFKQQIELMKEELSSGYQSFNEYKLRAQRILQDKDRLLQDIKQLQREDGIQPSELLVAELDQLQQERDLLREEIAQSNAQLQQSRKELSASQERFDEEIRSLRSINNSIEVRLTEEKSRRELSEGESKNLADELRYVREDLAQQKVQSAGRIQQLESELGKIRQQLTSKQNNAAPSQVELEQRLRTLTETLVAKQAALEVVQSERSSLVLQLERANKLLETGHSTPQNDSSTRVLLNITDDELAKVSSGVTRRVRSAYSSLDSLNFRLGQALRRRPAARLILFFYMVVLHFWVVFVLLTYTPEMHDKEH